MWDNLVQILRSADFGKIQDDFTIKFRDMKFEYKKRPKQILRPASGLWARLQL